MSIEGKYTADDLSDHVELYKEEIDANFWNSKDLPDSLKSDHLLRMWRAGCWLNHVLAAEGATPKEITAIGFVHGQRSAFGDAVEWALRYANEFAATGKVADQPGIALADEINTELFGAELFGSTEGLFR